MNPPTLFSSCPKCAHAPLPADQSLPATCPACGLVLAKFGTAPLPRARQSESTRLDDAFRWLAGCVTHVPARVDATGLWLRAGALAFFAVWGLRLMAMDFRIGEIGASFLHGPLLVFHEAGHVIFMFLGEFVAIAGGTLMQMIVPAVLCGALLVKNRDPFGAAIGLWLLGVSLLDVAPYAYDALKPQLVLLGGHTGEEGGHDFIYLFTRMGLLPRAQGIGWLIHKLGAAVVLISLYWAGWLLWQQRKRVAENPLLDDQG